MRNDYRTPYCTTPANTDASNINHIYIVINTEMVIELLLLLYVTIIKLFGIKRHVAFSNVSMVI